jgi:HKD family nuclease
MALPIKPNKLKDFLGALVKWFKNPDVKALIKKLKNGFDFKLILEFLKKYTVNLLKRKAVKAVLKKVLGTAAGGGFLGFIITYVVEEFFEEVAEPIIKLAFRKMGYLYERKQGKILVKKLNEAIDQGDENESDQILDNV